MKKKTFNWLAILLMMVLPAACTDARFDRIPGVYQDMMPLELMGTWELSSSNIKSAYTDSLVIEIGSREITLSGSTPKNILSIHQHFQISRLHQYFVAGMSDKVVHSLWNLAIIEVSGNDLKVYPLHEDRFRFEPENPLQRYLGHKEMALPHEPVQAGPSASPDGGATPAPEAGMGAADMIHYYTANEDQIILYFERELKDKDYILLKKAGSSKRHEGRKNRK